MSKGKVLRYIEAAHIKAKGQGNNEDLKNIIILCPNCHKKMDKGKIIVDFEKKKVVEGGMSKILHHDAHLFVDV